MLNLLSKITTQKSKLFVFLFFIYFYLMIMCNFFLIKKIDFKIVKKMHEKKSKKHFRLGSCVCGCVYGCSKSLFSFLYIKKRNFFILFSTFDLIIIKKKTSSPMYSKTDSALVFSPHTQLCSHCPWSEFWSSIFHIPGHLLNLPPCIFVRHVRINMTFAVQPAHLFSFTSMFWPSTSTD